MMDAADLELFATGLHHATATTSGTELDAALAELGWHDALASDPQATIATLFELQGAAATHLVGARRGARLRARGSPLDEPTAVVLPALGSVDAARSARRRRVWSCEASAPHRVAQHADRGRGRRRPMSHRGRHRRAAHPHDRRHRPPARLGRGDRQRALVDAADSRRLARCGRRRPARPRPRAGRRLADDARAGPRPRRRADPVRPSHRPVPGRPSSPRREPRRDRGRRRGCSRGVGRRVARHRRDGQGDRRPQRPHRRPPLPAGAGRHRLHDRAPPPPLRPPCARPRPRCWATPAPSRSPSARSSSAPARSPPLLPL